MKTLGLASCAALLILAPVLASAQNRTPPAGSSSTGTATARGGESSGTTSSPSSNSNPGGASERGGGMVGGSLSSPASTGSMRGNYDGPRSGEMTSTARPRNTSPSVGQAVPVSERPRGDRPVYGQAIERTNTPQTVVVYNPYSGAYYNPYYGYYGGLYGYYGDWYGYYGDWNPWGPRAFGYYGWGPYMVPLSWYSGYLNTYSANAAPAAYRTSVTGSIKLKVKPKEAEVYVDGTYYGQVDDYDGAFQHLDLRSGNHQLEIRAKGFEALKVDLRVLPGKTITYSGEMTPVK